MKREDFKIEQQEVLDSTGKNLIVSASAGSGKTTVMIQKIIEDITVRKINLKNILVLTYTNASAEEMKQKLSIALYENASQNPDCIKQIDDLATADISTIHSFFQKTIKKYFTAINIDPDFSIIDETSVKKFEENALDLALEEYAETHPEKLALVAEIFGKSRNDKAIKSIVLKLDNFLKSTENPEVWQKITAMSLYTPDIKKSVAVRIVNQKLFENAKYHQKKFENFQKHCQNLGLVKYVEICNKIIAHFAVISQNPENFLSNCENIANYPSVTVRKNEDFPKESETMARLNDLAKKYCKKVKLWNFDKETFAKSMTETPLIISALLEITNIFREKFTSLKLKSNVLDYDDLEKYMLKVLENQPIRKEIASNFVNIYVDEYQDANRVQEKILSLICKPNNRFMVGDVKQSIYRFRQAEPDIFLENQKLFESDEQSDVKFLNCNFRSEKTILDFVNIIFGEIMTLRSAKIDYRMTSNLDGQAKYEKIAGQNIPSVEIDIIKKTETEDKPKPTELYKISRHQNLPKAYSSAQLEAFVVAKKILNLIGQKIYLPAEKREKTIDFSDITILLRSRGGYINEFCAVLAKFNIPVYANTNDPLYNDSDIQTLINLLSLCVNKNNDIALASSLHSVFGGLSLDELAKIRLFTDDKNATFFECVKNYSANDQILQKLQSFDNMLKNLKFEIRFNGIFSALNKVITTYNFNNYILEKTDGLEKLEKVKKFLNDFLAKNFDFDLVGFLDFASRNKEKVMSPNFSSGENCVNITTIHSSKGLEFPIVFMVNSGKNLNKEPEDKAVQINAKLGIGLKYFDVENRKKSNSVVLEAITISNFEEDFAEKLRLLYVALTRAKNHLFIVGTSPLGFEKIDNDLDILRKSTYLDLIVGALPEKFIENINQGQTIRDEKYSVNVLSDEVDFDFMENTEKRIIPIFFEKNKSQKMQEYFEFSYPYQTMITTKNTVTSILKSESPYTSQNYSPKNFTISEHLPFSFSELGTAYHEVLESVDFDNASLEAINQKISTMPQNLQSYIDASKILSAVKLLQGLNPQKVIKEQKFVMNIPHKEVVEGGNDDQILVQGVVDLVILGQKNILVDYKLTTQTSDEKIVQKYKTQLKLYKIATENALNIHLDECYILHINACKLIRVF